ncbi:hypothetical protein O3801_03965 [Gemella sp. 27098_8_149]|uniref:DUF6612 family protein n=1 Tax=Gemella sp. 27098_8_149 TaxID=3003689 RepID=UPI0025CEA01D|nr:DUF6612 family protein [uncultured Gemella sp.]
MTKSLKKYLLLIATVILSVTLAACGTGASTEQIVNKSVESSKNIKSTDFVATNSSEILVGEQTQTVENTVSGSLIIDPLAIKATTDVKAQGQSQTLELYIKDGTAYAKSTGQDEWVKSSSSSITAQFENLKKIANSEQILEFYKKIAKDFKKTEENGNYVLTYTGSGDQFKDLMVAVANASSGNEVNASAFNNVDFKNVTIKLVVTKDYTPVTNEVNMELATKNTSTPTTMKIKQNIQYSNVNNVKEIKLPDEVKNAKEVAADTQKSQ